MGRLFELISLQPPVLPYNTASVIVNVIYQWHLCLGHASNDKLCNLDSDGTLNNVSKFSSFDCLNCKFSKQPALSFTTLTLLYDTPFSLIHSDI